MSDVKAHFQQLLVWNEWCLNHLTARTHCLPCKGTGCKNGVYAANPCKCRVGTVSTQCLNNLMLPRKVMDLLGNHLPPANTTGARIVFAPISYTMERFKLKKVPHLPHGHMRADGSLSSRSTSGSSSHSTSIFRSWFSVDHKLASEGGPQVSSQPINVWQGDGGLSFQLHWALQSGSRPKISIGNALEYKCVQLLKCRLLLFLLKTKCQMQKRA